MLEWNLESRYFKPGSEFLDHLAKALGPRTKYHGTRSTDIRVATYVMSVVGREVADRNLEVMIWSTLCISVA